MEERHLNIKKVIITIAIFVFAFLIILGSALLTINGRNNKKEKQLSVRPKEVVTKNLEQPKNEVETDKSEVPNGEQNLINQEPEEQKPEEKPISSYDSKNLGKDPVYNENGSELVKEVYNSDEKQIFLTFDDGPSPNVTPQILDVLKRYNVPATFFILGSRAELYPDLVKQEYNAGHYIANHGYSHNYSAIYTSVQTVVDEYNSTESAIQNALGNPNFHSYLFRFPGGSSGGKYHNLKAEAKAHLRDNMGIASTNWNCLTGDAEGGKRSKEQLLDRLYETAAPYTSLVVLMHDADDKQTTADALPEIIEHYMAEGYTFKNYYEIFK